jgi:hypothetical protein
MTYTALRRYQRRKPTSLGGFFDDLLQSITGKSEEGHCVDRANADAAPFDAKVDDLVKNWNPTGFYPPKDVRDLISVTLKVVQQAQGVIDRAAAEPNASQASIMRATNDLARAGQRSLDYLDAARAVEQQGLRLVNAPGLKRWVTDTLATCSSAVVTAAVIGCIRPWWVGALSGFQAVFDVAFGVAKRIVGAALAIGEVALKVVGDLPDLYPYLKWGLLAGGAYLAWTKLRAERSGP